LADISIWWGIKFTNIRQSMLKLKTHSGFHELFRFWYVYKSTNMVVYFDWKTVIYIYVCRKYRTQFKLPMEKSVTFTGACAEFHLFFTIRSKLNILGAMCVYRGRFRHFHKGGGHFCFVFLKKKNRISKQFVLRNIKRYWGVIQRKNYKTC
jgi:hypothetical protein